MGCYDRLENDWIANVKDRHLESFLVDHLSTRTDDGKQIRVINKHGPQADQAADLQISASSQCALLVVSRTWP